MSSKAIAIPFAILMYATIAVECQSKNIIFNQVAEVFLFVCFPQSCTHQDLLSRNVLGLAIRIFQPRRRFYLSVMLTDGLTVLATR